MFRALCAACLVGTVVSAAPPVRRPLDPSERNAVLALIAAVDATQQAGAAEAPFTWDHHVLKSVDNTAFVPLRVFTPDALASAKSLAMYVRAVSRHDGLPSAEERSFVRDWLLRNGDAPPPREEAVSFATGELPVGGPATSSARRATQAAAEASAALALQTRQLERQKALEEAAKKKSETKQRDPYRFAFEEYYFTAGGKVVERAVGLPPGEYDLYVALLDRARLKTSSPSIVHRTITVPDFWDEHLSISSVILAQDVKTLSAPLPAQQQAAHPYTFGHAEVLPVVTPEFSSNDVLSVVFQICNFGSPDTDLTVDYAFYRIGRPDGQRVLFNRTQPQLLADDDLPKQANAWETQAFTVQSIPLKPFPAGRYELEITVRDRMIRESATQTATFTVR